MNGENNSTESVVATRDPETMLLFDREDDAQIVARIQGAALAQMVYHFRSGNQDVYDLGIDGVEECKRELAKRGEVIREDDIKLESENPDEGRFKAYCSRYAIIGMKEVKLDTSVDVKRQPKFITTRNGTQLPDEFWYEKGASKAMRNAVKNLIPQTIQQTVIERFKASARTIAATPDKVDARVNEIHDNRDQKVRDLKQAWRDKGLMRSEVAAILHDKNLSPALADQHVSWSTVDIAVIDEMLAEARR